MNRVLRRCIQRRTFRHVRRIYNVRRQNIDNAAVTEIRGLVDTHYAEETTGVGGLGVAVANA